MLGLETKPKALHMLSKLLPLSCISSPQNILIFHCSVTSAPQWVAFYLSPTGSERIWILSPQYLFSAFSLSLTYSTYCNTKAVNFDLVKFTAPFHLGICISLFLILQRPPCSCTIIIQYSPTFSSSIPMKQSRFTGVTIQLYVLLNGKFSSFNKNN